MVTLIVTVLGILSALSVAAGAFYSKRAYRRPNVIHTDVWSVDDAEKYFHEWQLKEGARDLTVTERRTAQVSGWTTVPDASQLVEGVRMQTQPLPNPVTSPDAGVVAEELEAFAAHLESDDRETPFRFYVTPLVVHSEVSSLVGYRADGTLDWEDGAQRARELAWAWRQTKKPEPTKHVADHMMQPDCPACPDEGSHPSIRGHNATGFTVIDYRRGSIQSAADEWRRLNPGKW